jgi:hypothetical protein
MSEELVYINNISGSVRISELGITFSSDLEYEEWYRLIGTLARLETAFQFAIGDALNYGSAKYGEKYSNAMDATGFAYQSLANWTWVSKHVPIENRVAGLSWSHHRSVATCDVTQQKQLLEAAKMRGLSAFDLTSEIQGDPEEKPKPKQISIPEGWSVDDANKALEMISSYKDGLNALCEAIETKDQHVQRYCAECPYNN